MEGSEIIYVETRGNEYESDRVASLLVVLRHQVHDPLQLVLSVCETLDAILLDRDTEVVAILHSRYPQKDPQTERVQNGNGVADFLIQIICHVDEQLVVTRPDTILPD